MPSIAVGSLQQCAPGQTQIPTRTTVTAVHGFCSSCSVVAAMVGGMCQGAPQGLQGGHAAAMVSWTKARKGRPVTLEPGLTWRYGPDWSGSLLGAGGLCGWAPHWQGTGLPGAASPPRRWGTPACTADPALAWQKPGLDRPESASQSCSRQQGGQHALPRCWQGGSASSHRQGICSFTGAGSPLAAAAGGLRGTTRASAVVPGQHGEPEPVSTWGRCAKGGDSELGGCSTCKASRCFWNRTAGMATNWEFGLPSPPCTGWACSAGRPWAARCTVSCARCGHSQCGCWGACGPGESPGLLGPGEWAESLRQR